MPISYRPNKVAGALARHLNMSEEEVEQRRDPDPRWNMPVYTINGCFWAEARRKPKCPGRGEFKWYREQNPQHPELRLWRSWGDPQ